jgi:hypothetical protein
VIQRVLWGGAALWVLFAALQFNDPDPGVWIFLYAMTALYTAASARGVMPRSAALAWSVLSLCGGTWLFASWDGSSSPMGPTSMGLLSEEVIREAGGLGLVGIWSGFLAYRAEPVGAIETDSGEQPS